MDLHRHDWRKWNCYLLKTTYLYSSIISQYIVEKKNVLCMFVGQTVKWHLQFLGKAGLITEQLMPVLLGKADSCGIRTAAAFFLLSIASEFPWNS